MGSSVSTLVTTREAPWQSQHFNLATHVGDQAHVDRNRCYVSRVLAGCDIQWLQQVHGVESVYVDAVVRNAPAVDAIWTDQPTIALAIMTADCLPVLLASRDGSVVAAAHAGWQGLVGGILTKLVSSLPVPASDLCAWLGPAISRQHYEVGEDVWGKFPPEHCYPHKEASHRMLDLAGIAKAELESLALHRVDESGCCVYEQKGFFSHRASQHEQRPEGRFVTLIVRQPL